MDRNDKGHAGRDLPIDPREFSNAPNSIHRAPDMGRLRAYRLARVREQLRKRDLAGCLLFDPVNIRYATDSRHAGRRQRGGRQA